MHGYETLRQKHQYLLSNDAPTRPNNAPLNDTCCDTEGSDIFGSLFSGESLMMKRRAAQLAKSLRLLALRKDRWPVELQRPKISEQVYNKSRNETSTAICLNQDSQ